MGPTANELKEATKPTLPPNCSASELTTIATVIRRCERQLGTLSVDQAAWAAKSLWETYRKSDPE